MSKIFVVTYFENNRYADSDKVITDIYHDSAEKEVEQLCFALEGYLVNTSIIREFFMYIQ